MLTEVRSDGTELKSQQQSINQAQLIFRCFRKTFFMLLEFRIANVSSIFIQGRVPDASLQHKTKEILPKSQTLLTQLELYSQILPMTLGCRIKCSWLRQKSPGILLAFQHQSLPSFTVLQLKLEAKKLQAQKSSLKIRLCWINYSHIVQKKNAQDRFFHPPLIPKFIFLRERTTALHLFKSIVVPTTALLQSI